MSGIHISSVNKITLVGKVVGKFNFGKTSNGQEYCRLTLQTDEYLVVKGQSTVVSTRHEVLITNKYAVPAFKQYLKEGFFIHVTGKRGDENGKNIIYVTDFGHEAQFMYVPSDADNQTPKQEAGKGGSVNMNDLPSNSSNNTDDDYFSQDAAFDRSGPSSGPEGFDDDIPF